MRRFFAILSTTSLINLAIMVIAIINGVSFLLYYLFEGDLKGYLTTIEYLKAAIILSFLWGLIAYKLRKYVLENPFDAMIVTALVWLTVPLSSTVIYVFTTNANPIDSFFESISGFSGTGLTVFTQLEAIPYVILTWRAITQWLGELGTVVITGVILPFIHSSLVMVYQIERGPRLVATIRRSMANLFIIYIAYTLFGTALLIASGMNFLDALTHSMTAIATGGMSTKTQSIGYWFSQGNSIVLLTTSIIMIIGALNFRDLYKLSIGDLKSFAKSPEVKGFFALLSIIIIFAILISIALNAGYAIVPLVYHIVSGYTTTGFQIGDIKPYPTIFKAILIVSMAIGGATFSTAGGIKTRRIVIALKNIMWDIEKSVLPRGYRTVKRIGEEILDDEAIVSSITYIVIYLLFQLLLSIALYTTLVLGGFRNFDFFDAVFEVTSSLSCVGLSVGIVSPAIPLASKVVLMIAMYFGRLEFLPLYLLMGSYYRRKTLL